MLKVNEYFEGRVKSIALQSGGGKATVGVMEKGDYEFGTDSVEVMKVVSGTMSVKLPGSEAWKDFPAGSEFTVAAKQKFQLRLQEDCAYLCLYR